MLFLTAWIGSIEALENLDTWVEHVVAWLKLHRLLVVWEINVQLSGDLQIITPINRLFWTSLKIELVTCAVSMRLAGVARPTGAALVSFTERARNVPYAPSCRCFFRFSWGCSPLPDAAAGAGSEVSAVFFFLLGLTTSAFLLR